MDTIHPIDFEALAKGDVVTQGTVESASNVRHDEDPERYRLEMLKLRERIMSERTDLVVRCKGRALAVLTDQEAELYTVDRFGQLVSMTLRNTKTRARINREHFTELEKRKAESWDQVMTGQALEAAQALVRGRAREVALILPRPKLRS